ncbi:glycosyltransferase family 4 protein [Patescibacteria group bacterium]|nr:glycosyltransferase family 4 protein [Patescibacteria group bacterium]
MKICLYSPYVPKHFGGGEKYFFDVATILAQDHKVTVALPREIKPTEILEKVARYEDFFHRSLEKISFLPTPLHDGSVIEKLRWTRKFDCCIAVTDGSMFLSAAKKNILHIQVPYTHPQNGLGNRFKLRNWKIKNANSAFTKGIVERAWKTKIQFVHYPAIDQACFQAVDKKEKIILSVGRFFRQLHSKRQDILVQAFAQLLHQEPELMKGWKLVFIGSVEDQSFLTEVQQYAKSLPVEFYTRINRQELLTWYRRASLYWHAAGFEVNQDEHPEQVEHFGISTAEAMASGCIPVVVGKGGQVEVLGEQLQALEWQTIDDCCRITSNLLKQPGDWPAWQTAIKNQAAQFSESRFSQTLYEMIGK